MIKNGWAVVLVATTLGLGCGPAGPGLPDGGGTPSSGGGPGPGGSSGPGGGGSCCVQGAFHACETRTAFEACMGFDVAGCHAACGPDPSCHQGCDARATSARPDASGCRREAARDGECTTGGGGGCTVARPSCRYSSDCASGEGCNTQVGRCFRQSARCVGTRCRWASDCANGESCNVTEEMCYRLDESQRGHACRWSSDCGSGGCNTTTGRCF